MKITKEHLMNPENHVECECGNVTIHEYSWGDEYTDCPDCIVEVLHGLRKEYKKLIYEIADPDLSKFQIDHMIKTRIAPVIGLSCAEDFNEMDLKLEDY